MLVLLLVSAVFLLILGACALNPKLAIKVLMGLLAFAVLGVGVGLATGVL